MQTVERLNNRKPCNLRLCGSLGCSGPKMVF
jgi:hypothetical protein